MLLRTFTPETLTGSQNFDTFHKPTNVELLANQLVLMETTVTTTVIIQVCINSIASTVTFIVLYYYNMVLLSRHSADTGGGGGGESAHDSRALSLSNSLLRAWVRRFNVVKKRLLISYCEILKMKFFSSVILKNFSNHLTWKLSWTPSHKWSPLFQWTWTWLMNFLLQKG